MAKSAECKCTHNFTCGYCLSNAPPYHFTPSSVMAKWVNPNPQKGNSK